MLLWLIGVAVFVLLWGALWGSSPKAAYGAVFGFVLALVVYWFFSQQLTDYVIGMNEIPVWLPPLPIALVVIVLFYFGIRTWLNADNLPPPRESESHDEQHGHGHH
jgi:phosphotransferase system  glucose/maltose/N-acetylglucosamine-specific IIC component